MVEWEAANISRPLSPSASSSASSIHSGKNGSDDDDSISLSSPFPSSSQRSRSNVNSKKRKQISSSGGGTDGDNDNQHGNQHGNATKIQKRKKKETPEAAIARLTNAYSMAMNTIGALYKANQVILKQNQQTKKKTGQEKEEQQQPQQQQQGEQERNTSNSNENETQNKNNQERLQSLQRVAYAARNTFEHTILSDPLVMSYVPTLSNILHQHKQQKKSSSSISSNNNNRNRHLIGGYYQSPVLLSEAHKQTIKELTYVSLVNYADLILSCCSCSTNGGNPSCSGDKSHTNNKQQQQQQQKKSKEKTDVLDHGVIHLLDAIRILSTTPASSSDDNDDQDSTCLTDSNANTVTTNANNITTTTTSSSSSSSLFCIWNNIETREQSKRIALVSYCDASDIDGSDPNLWLKIACSARSLNNELLNRKNLSALSSSPSKYYNKNAYHRLERFALEHGLNALKPGTPSNRMIRKAFHELERKELDSDIVPYNDNDSFTAMSTSASTSMPTLISTLVPNDESVLCEKAKLVIDLPRYSWLTLGRLLLRAYREGVTSSSMMGPSSSSPPCSSSWTVESSWNDELQIYPTKIFGSPTIYLQISPMLTLPPIALGIICEYLGDAGGTVSTTTTTSTLTANRTTEVRGNLDIQHLEETCRSLSVDIISARAMIEKNRNIRLKQMEKEMHQILTQEQADGINDDDDDHHDNDDHHEHFNTSPNLDGTKDSNTMACDDIHMAAATTTTSTSNMKENTSSNEETKKLTTIRAHRTSKRVRSQLITSGKQAERSARRKSVEYCLISSVMPCTVGHPIYSSCLNDESFVWETLEPLRSCIEFEKNFLEPNSKEVDDTSSNSSLFNKQRSNMKDASAKYSVQDGSIRLGKASFHVFINRWGKMNSGAVDVIHRFISHISCFMEEVCSSEQGGVMMLTSCILECFEILTEIESKDSTLCSSWYGESTFSPQEQNITVAIETFAINLLHAELQMRACDREGFGCDSYFDKGHIVQSLLTQLLQYGASFFDCDISVQFMKLVAKLKTRMHFLAAIFYVSWSKQTQNLSDVKEAEKMALESINIAIETLKSPAKNPIHVIKTAHLVSTGRSGLHWSELSVKTLVAFRDELESSTVLSHCRQKFCNLIAGWQKLGYTAISDLPSEEKGKLKAVGEELLDRYQFGNGTIRRGEKTDELLDEFMNLYDSYLTPSGNAVESDAGVEVSDRWLPIWSAVPTKPSSDILDGISNPSFITIISLSFLCESNYIDHMASFLSSVIMAGLRYHILLLSKMEQMSLSINSHSFDDGDSSSDDNSNTGNERQYMDLIPKKAQVMLQISHYFMIKLLDLTKESTVNDLKSCIKALDIVALIKIATEASTGFLSKASPMNYTSPDKDLLTTTLKLASTFQRALVGTNEEQNFISAIFAILVQNLVRERHAIPGLLRSKAGGHIGRSDLQKMCMTRAEVIAIISSEIAALMSCHNNKYSIDGIEESFLIKTLVKIEKDKQQNHQLYSISKFTESLVWFWRLISSGSEFDSNVVSSSSSVQKKIAGILRMPIASAIIALIGCAGHGNGISISKAFAEHEIHQSVEQQNLLSLSDYFDSDASTKDWVNEDNVDNQEEKSITFRRAILQSMCRSVQCIGLVFSLCDETEFSSMKTFIVAETNHNCFLPSLVVMVLTDLSDFVLMQYGEADSSPSGIWAEEYPFGFRSAGIQLDVILHKAYSSLYGINLSLQQNYSVPKDLAVPSATHSTLQNKFTPESVKAAAQLYRCIMRAYSGGRRTIPPGALECVLSALPRVKESSRMTAIKKFLFLNEQESPCDPKEADSEILTAASENFEKMPPSFPSWVLQDDTDLSGDAMDSDTDDEAFIVRKGICKYFNEGNLPRLGPNDSSKNEVAEIVTEREEAFKTEKAVHKKFFHIMDALDYEPGSADKWYRAGLCLCLKIDTIMDRLTQLHQGYTAADFYVKKFNSRRERQIYFSKSNASLTPPDLLVQQHNNYFSQAEMSETILGCDLSLYLENQWSSFTCLSNMMSQLSLDNDKPIERNLEASKGGNVASQYSSWRLIQSKFEAGNNSEWQLILGRMFVMALQVIRERCFHVAYVLSSNHSEHKNESMNPEISESLGTMFYSDISFPVKVLTDVEMRKKARLAQWFFQHALGAVVQDSNNYEDLFEYELLFMIGKCQEKVAKTLRQEKLINGVSRLYEKAMKGALESYQKSLASAKSHERDGKVIDIQGGGSSHGSLEMLYRLHASRLKVLMSAIRKSEGEREMAEVEALRLTEAYWFERPNEVSEGSEPKDIRDRIWVVLSDIVESMVYCRREQAFFHRSVYRHAQALNWAPLFHDPNGSVEEGSLDSVPAYKSCRLRGLNSDSCARSAEAILSTLFDKKRAQLCAVWVTTPASPSPFEDINDSLRKFDRLRWKYIGSFVDCMRLCRRRALLENFIKWCHASRRDLPSFYFDSAAEEGGAPHELHFRGNLLIEKPGLIYFAIRYANKAVADIICDEVIEYMKNKGIEESERKTSITELLGEAFRCFSRLNCPVDDSFWQCSKCKSKVRSGNISEVEALCNAFRALHDIGSSQAYINSWEEKMLLLRTAVKEASRLFPSYAVGYDCSKRKRKRKVTGHVSINNTSTKHFHKSDDTEEATVSKDIVVKVPKGLAEGELFYAVVKCDDFEREVALRAVGTRKVMFRLDVPKSASSEVKVTLKQN